MKIMHLIDSLSSGGAERVAVNMVNTLNRVGIETHLCATRKEGVLKDLNLNHERYLFLDRKGTWDVKALFCLVGYIKEKKITILHAHSSSFFIAVLAKLFSGPVKVIWHDHYGKRYSLPFWKNLPLKIFSLWFDAVFTVNHTLKEWALKFLMVKKRSVFFVANYPELGTNYSATWNVDRLSVQSILCLANLRVPKDHHSLLKAFKLVKEWFPDASLVLAGKDDNDAYSTSVKQLIRDLGIKDVRILGQVQNVAELLDTASLGVISSQSEGLPLALLEYGAAGLPVVCTNVGECPKVMCDGAGGWVVPVGDYDKIASAIREAFNDPLKSVEYARKLNQEVSQNYSTQKTLDRLMSIYKSI